MASNLPLKNLKTFVCYIRSVAKSGLSTTHTKQNQSPVERLPLRDNIDPTEMTKFFPRRYGDKSANVILARSQIRSPNHCSSIENSHIRFYDCFGAVSLYSTKHSNVETPFRDIKNFTCYVLGRQWERRNTSLSNVSFRKSTSSECVMQGIQNRRNENMFSINNGVLTNTSVAFWQSSQSNVRSCSTGSTEKKDDVKSNLSSSKDNEKKEVPLSRKEMLKKAMKDYGSTVIIFYVGISVISFGSFYVLVSSGLDIVAILQHFGWGDSALSNKLAAGASTFVVAYAVHMVFASVRISITLAAAPFIVRYLRNKGFLKKPSGSK